MKLSVMFFVIFLSVVSVAAQDDWYPIVEDPVIPEGTVGLTAKWDKNKEPDMNNYRVWTGHGSGNYSFVYTVFDTTYAFRWAEDSACHAVVSAVDVWGNESGPSEERSWVPSGDILGDMDDNGYLSGNDELVWRLRWNASPVDSTLDINGINGVTGQDLLDLRMLIVYGKPRGVR